MCPTMHSKITRLSPRQMFLVRRMFYGWSDFLQPIYENLCDESAIPVYLGAVIYDNSYGFND